MQGEISAAALHGKARRVVQLLRERGQTLATAESCTGGLIAKSVTDIAGSSAVFVGACVTYTNRIKMELLGVSEDIIRRDSEVSDRCAAAMASGVGQRLHTDYALSTTGYAGPDGGTEQSPVGTVYIGIMTPNGCRSERFCAPPGSGRTQVRNAAAWYALELLEQECKR